MAYMCQGCSAEGESWPGVCPSCGSNLYLNIAAKKPELIGTVINGRYKVVAKLGQGGMGTVYKAVREEMGQTLAIKMLNPEFSNEPEVVKRFLREAKSYGTIQHPNAVNLLDFGQTGEGALFIAMEFIAGQDLGRTIVERGRLPIADATDICVQCCDVLGYAHEKGIIHRDLKPENVMLTRGLRSYHAKVLDFGIARLMSDTATQLTIQGTICGTPRYMSPEQARGKEIDNRSDVYALGLVLFEMLTGRQAYTYSSITDLLRAQVTEPVPHLWEAEGGRDLPEGLDLVVQRACAKDRDQRFVSMGQFADVLSKALPTQHELRPFPEQASHDPAAPGRTFLGPAAINALAPPPVGGPTLASTGPAIPAELLARSVTPRAPLEGATHLREPQASATEPHTPQSHTLPLANERPAPRQASKSRGGWLALTGVVAIVAVAAVAWPKLNPGPPAPGLPAPPRITPQPVGVAPSVQPPQPAPTAVPPSPAAQPAPVAAAPLPAPQPATSPTPAPTPNPTHVRHAPAAHAASLGAVNELENRAAYRDAERDFAAGQLKAALVSLDQVDAKAAVAADASALRRQVLEARRLLDLGNRAASAGDCPAASGAYKKALALSGGLHEAQAGIERCQRAALPTTMESP